MSKKIVSLFDKKDDDDHERDHERGQAFYAGGSEHSGQQILGPNRDGLIESLMNSARQHVEERQAPSGNTLPVTFWRNGFTVGDDNELRDYASNRQFLDYLRRGEVPPELAARVRGGMIDVKLDNKPHQDFKSEHKPQAFTGEGHRLGAPTPAVVSEQQDSQQSHSSTNPPTESSPSVDEIRQKRLARFSQQQQKH